MSREEYVRPPLVAAEAPSPTVARWRYRAVATVALLLLLVFFTWAFFQLKDVTGSGEDPGLGAQPGSGIVSTALVPRG